VTAGLTVLGFDVGRRRLGVAVGQTVSGSASPLAVLPRQGPGFDWPRIDRLVADWAPQGFVLGWPTLADGSTHPLAADIDTLAAGLSARYGLPVHRVDERLSSHEAASRPLSARRRPRPGRRTHLDDVAAQVIVETWLNEARSP
jgi:putative Holliday junction resolvase